MNWKLRIILILFSHIYTSNSCKELKISYTPPEGFARPEWIQREYSRGGFVRTFVLDDLIDAANITAKYEDGVLYVSLPILQGKETTKKEIKIN